MKSRHIAAFLVCLLLPSLASGTITHERSRWWDLSITKLEQERSTLKRENHLHPSVADLLTSRITRGREMVSIFRESLSGSGSLSEETRLYNASDITDFVDRFVEQYTAIQAIQELARRAGTGETVEYARAAASARITGMAEKRYGSNSRELVTLILKEDISNAEWQSLSLELLITRLMERVRDVRGDIRSEVMGDILSRMPERGYRTTASGIERMVLDAVKKKIPGTLIIQESKPDIRALESTWTWKRLCGDIERNMDHYTTIISFLKPAHFPFHTIRYYYRNPVKLEAVLFSSMKSRYIRPPSAHQVPADHVHGIVLAIPDYPGNSQCIRVMDRIRKKAMLGITGNESGEYLAGLSRRHDAVINRYLGRSRLLFDKEEKKYNALLKQRNREEEDEPPKIANEKAFSAAADDFRTTWGITYGYRTRSIDFLAWFSRLNRKNGAEMIDSYEIQAKRSAEYFGFIRDLVSAGTASTAFIDNRTHSAFMSAIQKTGKTRHFINFMLGPEKKYRSRLTARQTRELRRIRAEAAASLKIIESRISTATRDCALERSRLHRADNSRNRSMSGKIAAQEINIFYTNALECSRLYGRMCYPGDILEQYSRKFKELREAARSGKNDPGLQRVFLSNSILPCLAGYDPGRMQMEVLTKKYLKKMAEKTTAGMHSLIRYYSRKNIPLPECPAPTEVEEIRKPLKIKSEVRIASWGMNEDNYRDVDRKAVLELRRLADWMDHHGRKKNLTPAGDAKLIADIDEIGMTLHLPSGWIERTPGEVQKYRGIVRSYTCTALKSDIYIAVLPGSAGSIKEITEKNVLRERKKIINGKWAKFKGEDCYRGLSRDSGGNLFENYTMKHNGKIFILSGRSEKDSYRYFRKDFEFVVNSIGF